MEKDGLTGSPSLLIDSLNEWLVSRSLIIKRILFA